MIITHRCTIEGQIKPAVFNVNQSQVNVFGHSRNSARQLEERVDSIVDIFSQTTRVDGITEGFKLFLMLGQDR